MNTMHPSEAGIMNLRIRRIAFVLALGVLLFTAAAQAVTGDVDGDGDVDRDDIDLILTARGDAAGLGDPRDLDGDGRITVLDARQASVLCTRPGCATFALDGIPGDLDGDGDVDRNDSDILLGDLGEPLIGADDPRDLDGDGAITSQDVRQLALLCTRRSCATEGEVPAPPEIVITDPAGGLLTRADSVDVSGTVSGSSVSVRVNRVEATVAAGTFTVTNVPLREGSNTLTAVARDSAEQITTTSVTVIRDTTPPSAVIESPTAGQIVTTATVAVVGMVNDVVIGTVGEEDCTVEISGRAGTVTAEVSNRTFFVPDFPLVPGTNTLTVVATDTAGNVGAPFEIDVVRRELAGPRIEIVGGNDQIGVIGEALPSQIFVQALDGFGSPLPNRLLTFRVVRNNGRLRTAGSPELRSEVAVRTDASGFASVEWILGNRAGTGNNRIEVSGAGFSVPALVCASGVANICDKLLAQSGENQVGVVGAALARPFEVVAVDPGGNLCADLPVTFRVEEGGGSFGGLSEIVVNTNADGRAAALLTLGSKAGLNNVVATSFPGLVGSGATFIASAEPVRPDILTRFVGVVLDTENEPIPNARVLFEDTDPPLESFTDENGQFVLDNPPVGNGLLFVDGATTPRPGRWPHLEYQVDVVAGIDNTLGMPVFLPELDSSGFKLVGGSEDVILEMAGVEGFAMKILANSATFPDGSRTGFMGVTQVSNDQVPMPPNGGAAPPWVGTLQPAGVTLDPPAQLIVPNALGLPPGQIIDLFTFDHDLQEFIGAGTGTVQPDGATVVSDPGSGIRKSGWFFDCPPPPPPTCAAACDPCEKCERGMCVPDTSKDGMVCADAPQSFSSNGVNITIGDGCRGTCKSGVCESGGTRKGIKTITDAARDALSKTFGTCMGDPLRTTMQDSLKKNGLSINCVDSSDSNGNGKSDCASAAVGGNTMTLSNLSAKSCGSLAKTIRHEAQHGAGSRGHTSDIKDDTVYACDLKCYGTSNKKGADPAKCM